MSGRGHPSSLRCRTGPPHLPRQQADSSARSADMRSRAENLAISSPAGEPGRAALGLPPTGQEGVEDNAVTLRSSMSLAVRPEDTALIRPGTERRSMGDRRTGSTLQTPLRQRDIHAATRWQRIARAQEHPALAECESDLRTCLAMPSLIRESTKEPDVHMYYAYRWNDDPSSASVTAPVGARTNALWLPPISRRTSNRGTSYGKAEGLLCIARGTPGAYRFDDPKKEAVCEEADDDVVLVKDRAAESTVGFRCGSTGSHGQAA